MLGITGRCRRAASDHITLILLPVESTLGAKLIKKKKINTHVKYSLTDAVGQHFRLASKLRNPKIINTYNQV